jgi:hypothetical protein
VATKSDREGAKLNRDEYSDRLAHLGHDVIWKLAPNASRKGYCYFFQGACRNCHGTINVASLWSSCSNVIDLRADKPCSGAGTGVLTDIEDARVAELIAPAITEFATAVRAVRATIATLN